MAFDIYIRPEAQNDITQIALWYQHQVHELGNDLDERFLNTLESTLDKLSHIGDSFGIIYNNTRKVLLSKFPYAVHYLIENNTLIVFAVLHTSRNPMIWQQQADNLN